MGLGAILMIFVIFGCTSKISCHELHPLKIARFFSTKNVYSIDAIPCTQQDRVDLFKYFTIASRNEGYSGLFRTTSFLDEEQCLAEERVGIYIDVSCTSNREILINTTNEMCFTINIIWLVRTPSTFLEDFLLELPISTFSEVTIATSTGLYQLFKSAHFLPTEVHSVGEWDTSTDDFFIRPLDIKINYQKKPIDLTMLFIDDIYDMSQLQQQIKNDSYKPNGDVANRFMYENILNLAYLYNLTLNLKVTNSWGDRLPNGTWTAMLGQLQSGEADLTVNLMLPLSERIDVSYPSVPSSSYWMAIVFKQPRALGTYRAMILELSLSTWACVGATIIIGALVFAMTQKYEPDPEASFDADGSFGLAIVQSLGIIANQGLSVTPKGTSSRIVCLFLLLVGLLVSNYYSAATMTALLSESPPVIKNLEQLVDTRPALSALDTAYIKNRQASRRVFQEIIIDRMLEEGALTIRSLDDCVQSIMNGSSFIGEYFVLFDAINSRLQSDTICDLTVINAGFLANTMNFIKKNLHFRELHTRGILRTLEHGLMQKAREKWISQKMICSRVTEFIHVHLEAVSVALYVFSSGVFLSLTLLFFEMFMAKRAKRTLQLNHVDRVPMNE